MLPLLTVLGLATPAHAFCGTYVGQAGAALYNNASQVVLVHQERQTTLTLANDFDGDLEDFALVVPIPNIVEGGDVSVVDPELIQRIDAYSAPRLVQYTCDDFNTETGTSTSATDSSSSRGAGDEASGSVTIEAEFSVGEYDLVVLSAEQSADLFTWLTESGYAVPESSTPLLQEYIDDGSYFLAARVDPADLPDGQTWLRPLQIAYGAPTMNLPIRLGTLNSQGVQDLLIYVINDESDGAAGISNYTEHELEDECMVDLADGGTSSDFADFWEDTLEDIRTGSPGARWTREYAWAPAWCDPCAGDPLRDEDIQALGYDGSAWDAFFTRLHLRYEADQATQDVVIYASKDETRLQARFILYDPALEDRFPLCGSGWADDPGSCDPADDTDTTDDTQDPGTDDEGGRFGCNAAPVPAMMAAVLALCALVTRRRD